MASSWDEEGVKEKGQQSGSEGNEPEHRTGSDIALTAAATAASTPRPSPDRRHPGRIPGSAGEFLARKAGRWQVADPGASLS
jgi:hypothetical protein